jgi:hypothetical protein
MFEKEAEERITEQYGTSGEYITRQRIWQDGAEVGYNKANEWHYVKDGIFPTHSNRVLVFTDEGAGFGLYGLDDKKWHTYDTGFDVIAWKEIVLPELPKESE